MKPLKDKKLLIMGGPALACDIVKKAREMGIYTIVTDWYEPEKSPAKQIADEYAMISTSDIDALKALISDKKIDGVITAFIDSTLPNIQMLSEKTGLPFYATKKQLEDTIDKSKFKTLCRKYGVPVVKEIDIKKLSDKDFPLVVKPTDSSGAKGISVCKNKKDFEPAYEKALSFSKSKNVILEKFMDAIRANINLDYVICDGRVHLSAVGDLYAFQMDETLTPITSAVFYPSVHTADYAEKLDGKVVKMLEGMNLKNGFLYIQSFYDEEGYYFYETGYRLGGGQSYRMIEKLNGINHLEMLINYALTGIMCDSTVESKISPFFKKSACGLCIIVKSGKISKIEGLEKLEKRKGIVNITQLLHEGDIVEKSHLGTAQQLFARTHIVEKNREETEETIEFIFNTLKITDENGENMLLKSYERVK